MKMPPTAVILQPQYFPWLGVFEQIASCQIYVHLDDVQLPIGRSFTTRVQVKTAQGVSWLTAPVVRNAGQTILETKTDDSTDWRSKHLKTLKAAFTNYPFKDDAVAIVEQTYLGSGDNIAAINIRAIELISAYMGLSPQFMRSSQMKKTGVKDDLLLSILQGCGASDYLTGMGALNYLDHERFERLGHPVRYPVYSNAEYPQRHGDFTPYVSSLDAIAACGKDAKYLLAKQTRPWRDVVSEK